MVFVGDWFQVLKDLNHKFAIFFMCIKSLKVAFQFKAKVWHGEIFFKAVPKLKVQELHVKSSLNFCWKVRHDSVIIDVNSNVLVITPPIIKIVDYPLP